VRAAATLSEQEARFLVDGYYLMQDGRKRANNQLRSMPDEPHGLIDWLAEQSEILEGQIKRTLDTYAEANVIGRWLKSIYGVGPVIAAGMLAHIDITQAPTAGHIWRFAGLDPTVKWGKGEKRPWNAEFKTLCWKTGQTFMKFSNEEECVYGHVYKKRKAYEVARNDSGGNAERAAADVAANRYKKKTDAFKAVSKGKLPDAQVDAQARRYTVKLFLSHIHCAMWWQRFHELPRDPYAIAHLGHAHFIPLPNPEAIDGLAEALAAKGWT
jgi:hypothetical protein